MTMGNKCVSIRQGSSMRMQRAGIERRWAETLQTREREGDLRGPPAQGSLLPTRVGNPVRDREASCTAHRGDSCFLQDIRKQETLR